MPAIPQHNCSTANFQYPISVTSRNMEHTTKLVYPLHRVSTFNIQIAINYGNQPPVPTSLDLYG